MSFQMAQDLGFQEIRKFEEKISEILGIKGKNPASHCT